MAKRGGCERCYCNDDLLNSIFEGILCVLLFVVICVSFATLLFRYLKGMDNNRTSGSEVHGGRSLW